jgi:hypothetical protein
MSTHSTADIAPTSGNRPVKENWAGKHFCDIDVDDLLSMRAYIVSEASSLGQNHGRRKCADAHATNPFHTEFFLGKPYRFWNAVYQQSAIEGEMTNDKSLFTQASIQRPLDTIPGNQLLITLSAIDALKKLNEDYCSAMDELCLEQPAQLTTEWQAALVWYDLNESDFALLLDYRSARITESKKIESRHLKEELSLSIS